jgi:spoIIIJ-associated protein
VAAQEESSVLDEVPIEEQATAAQDFTVGLIDAFGVEARVATEVRDDAVHVDIAGDGLGLLVGPKGATLAALEEIVRAVVQRSTGGHSARVHVDVGGYRQRRRDALADFARKLAAEVKDEGVERTLEPMSPPDRKVVHDAISEMEGVTTTSQGEEPRRRVVIRPG